MPFGISLGPKSIPLGGAGDPRASSLAEDLVSWWKLDETSGTRADSVGGNDLTDVNTTPSAGGLVQTRVAGYFSSGAYLYNDTYHIPAGTTKLTITLSVRVATLNSYIVAWDYTTGQGIRIGCAANGSKTNVYIADSAGTGTVTAVYPIQIATIHFVAVVYDGTQSTNATKLKFYSNGLELTADSFSGGTGTIASSLDGTGGNGLGLMALPNGTGATAAKLQSVGLLVGTALASAQIPLRGYPYGTCPYKSLVTNWFLDDYINGGTADYGSTNLTLSGSLTNRISSGDIANSMVVDEKTSVAAVVNYQGANVESLSLAQCGTLAGGSGDFTVAGWLITGFPSGNINPIVCGTDTTTYNWRIQRTNSSLNTVFACQDASGNVSSVTVGIPAHYVRFFFVARYNSSTKKAELSINGSAFTVSSTALVGTFRNDQTMPFIFGSTTGSAMCGLDEFGLWNRLLSASEVSYLFSGRTYSGGRII